MVDNTGPIGYNSQKDKILIKYYKIKENSANIFSNILRRESQGNVQIGKSEEREETPSSPYNQKSKERAKHLFCLRTKQRGAGVSRLTVKANATEE